MFERAKAWYLALPEPAKWAVAIGAAILIVLILKGFGQIQLPVEGPGMN